MQKKRAALISLGCKVNSYESQGMQELLEQDGWTVVPPEEEAELYLVNTCTVTGIAARKSRQELRSLRRDHPDALIGAAGCYVEQICAETDRDSEVPKERIRSEAAEELLRDRTVNFIVPNKRKKDLLPILHAAQEGAEAAEALCRASAEEPELCIHAHEGHTRAFLKVQDGCRQFCSYCIIPYARGPLCSKPLEDAAKEAQGLAQAGYPEIVLTGIHLSSYGRGLDYDLSDLILAVAAVPEVARIRLGSLEPRIMTEAFLQKLSACPKLCPHFHLSLQSGAENTLKAMNRHYSAHEYAETLERIRRYFPQAALTTDVIVGFPGETDEDFAESLAFVKAQRFAEVHVFRYSRREGTVADRMPAQVAESLKKSRSEAMIEACEAMSASFLNEHIGRETELLIEEEEGGFWYGHTPDYVLTAVPDNGKIRQGSVLSARPLRLLSGSKGLYLQGEITCQLS